MLEVPSTISSSSGGVTISILSIKSKVMSRVIGFVGEFSQTDVVVLSNGLLRRTSPAAVSTVISPEDKPLRSGRRITKLLPNSSTVTVKSVPRIPIWLVGVLILIFSLLIPPIFPVINLAVPEAKVSPILDLLGSGSKITSSSTSLECSVRRTTLSSMKVSPTLLLAVLTSSYDSTSSPITAVKLSSLIT